MILLIALVSLSNYSLFKFVTIKLPTLTKKQAPTLHFPSKTSNTIYLQILLNHKQTQPLWIPQSARVKGHLLDITEALNYESLNEILYTAS